MRLLFAARPQFGHIYPLMPLAEAARDAGHRVAFATTGSFLERLAAWGFETFDVGITVEQANDAVERSAGHPEAGVPRLERSVAVFVDQMARATAADLRPVIADFRPDAVVYEQVEFGAAVAARQARVAAVSHALSRDVPTVFADAVRRRMTAIWPELGDWDPVHGDVLVDIVPACLQRRTVLDHPARVAMRSVPWAEPGLPRAAVRGTRPLVYVTLGTMFATADDLHRMVTAVAASDVDVLVALGPVSPDAFGTAPDNVRVERFVDQPQALAVSDLIVHHGGSGTLFGALFHGKRQVVLPKGADQFFNADAALAAGLAAVLLPADATAENLAAAVREALAGPVAPAVLAAKAEIAEAPSPADALEVLVRRVAAAHGAA